MTKITYVQKRKSGGGCHFRQNVPADLHTVMGKKVIKVSLNTMGERTAGKPAAPCRRDDSESETSKLDALAFS